MHILLFFNPFTGNALHTGLKTHKGSRGAHVKRDSWLILCTILPHPFQMLCGPCSALFTQFGLQNDDKYSQKLSHINIFVSKQGFYLWPDTLPSVIYDLLENFVFVNTIYACRKSDILSKLKAIYPGTHMHIFSLKVSAIHQTVLFIVLMWNALCVHLIFMKRNLINM